jgi:hypothetical protein
MLSNKWQMKVCCSEKLEADMSASGIDNLLLNSPKAAIAGLFALIAIYSLFSNGLFKGYEFSTLSDR